MTWFEHVLWTLCRVYANVGTVVGLIGLAVFGLIGINSFYDWLLREEGQREDRD